jgi:hypothetical protein
MHLFVFVARTWSLHCQQSRLPLSVTSLADFSSTDTPLGTNWKITLFRVCFQRVSMFYWTYSSRSNSTSLWSNATSISHLYRFQRSLQHLHSSSTQTGSLFSSFWLFHNHITLVLFSWLLIDSWFGLIISRQVHCSVSWRELQFFQYLFYSSISIGHSLVRNLSIFILL